MFKIQTLFIVTAFLITLINILFLKYTIDIQFYDTYYVVPQKLLGQIFSLICILNFVVYFAFARFNKPLQKPLGMSHYILTVFPVLALLLKLTDDMNALTMLAVIAAILFITAHVILLVNIYQTLRTSDKQSNNKGY